MVEVDNILEKIKIPKHQERNRTLNIPITIEEIETVIRHPLNPAKIRGWPI